jgi:hypothetical protein
LFAFPRGQKEYYSRQKTEMIQKAPQVNKYIVITGGVLSGLGKGIASASIGKLLSDKPKIAPIKCDGCLNTDPGTMNPVEHGEVFVLDDGGGAAIKKKTP